MKKIVYLFIFLNSEKNEPRSAAAVIGPFGLSLRSPSGGLRNSLRSNSPRPFPSVSLASSPPDKGGIGVCALARILTPSPFGHSPYIPFRNTGGEVEMYSSFALAPILYKTPRHATGHGRGRSENLSLCRNEKYHFQFSPLLVSFVMSCGRGRCLILFSLLRGWK